MEEVILVCTDPPARSRSAVDWATQEARLHGLPLRRVLGSPPDQSKAKMIVRGIPQEAAATGRPPGSRLPVAVGASDRPLVLVPDRLASAYRSEQVTLGVDARNPSDDAIDFAFDSARVRGARLHVVHAWSLPSCAAEWPFGIPEEDRATWEDHEVQLLADVLRPWREKYPQVPVLEDVVLFTPAEALLHHSEKAALVVVGRKSGAEWGEVVRALLHEATCPVAVVPSRPMS
ncbi:universal stress protein [Streptomyces sp. NBC_00996]|uniref:universal stress protein n=1 Tax=Streptomyces sp. NBC_00996 TaxID=2903710 RepID=UPI0038648153|nr:universal stress protein [Streptomyces sp. NBC_00996]